MAHSGVSRPTACPRRDNRHPRLPTEAFLIWLLMVHLREQKEQRVLAAVPWGDAIPYPPSAATRSYRMGRCSQCTIRRRKLDSFFLESPLPLEMTRIAAVPPRRCGPSCHHQQAEKRLWPRLLTVQRYVVEVELISNFLRSRLAFVEVLECVMCFVTPMRG